MIVLDASVLIAHFNRDDACHARAEAVLLDVAGQPLAASAVTLAEVLVGPARAGRLDIARAAIADLEVGEVLIQAGGAARLAQLRAGTGLKLPDCCVLLAAEDVNAVAVLTFDERLAKRVDELGFGWEPDQPEPPARESVKREADR